MTYQTSFEGIKLITNFEGLRLKAYQDTGGVWTIGYGNISYSDGTPVKKGDICTKEEAIEYLRDDLERFEKAVNDLVLVPINQEMFDALICFVYNIGETAFSKSTLLKKLNDKKYSEVPAQFLRWNKDNGKVIAGLTKRRQAEADLYNEGLKILCP